MPIQSPHSPCPSSSLTKTGNDSTAALSNTVARNYPLHQVLKTETEYLQELAEMTPSDNDGLTGIPQIDSMLGFVGGGLVSIESDTPWLDTQLALLMAAHMAEELPVVVVSSRLSAARVGQVLLCLRGGIALQHLLTGQLTDIEWLALTKQCQQPGTQNLDVVERAEVPAEELQRILLDIARKRGKLFMVVVDDVQALSDLSQFGTTSHSQGRNLANHFKDLAKTLGCIVVAVVPADLAPGFVSMAEVHMQLEAVRSKGRAVTFPTKTLVHLSRSGFGHLGAASIDFGAVHEVLA